MFPVVRSFIDRFKTLFLSHAVLELEADLIAAYIERKADLLRSADQYEKDGLASLAQELRQQAETLSSPRPFESSAVTVPSLLPHEAESANGSAPPPTPSSGKKKKPGIVNEVRRAAARNLRAALHQLDPD